jgi:two-component system, LuxR family, sensor kinase FixL
MNRQTPQHTPLKGLMDNIASDGGHGGVTGETEALNLLFDAVLTAVPDGMIVIDEHGQIAAFSVAAERILGFSAAETIGRNVSMLMTSADSHQHNRYIGNYIATGHAKIIGKGRVVDARHKDGRVIPVELKIGEARMGDHRLFAGFIRDLSEQQQIELRQRQMQNELMNFSRLSAVGTMSSAMAHELNQPLTAVANYLEACRDLLEQDDPETRAIVRDALDKAAQQAVRAGQIIRKLRDFVSRGEITCQPIALQSLIRDATTIALVGQPEPLPRIEEKIACDLPLVLADRVQIQQVLINLIRNAAEAHSELDKAVIRVEASLLRENDGLRAQVSVIDNGPGLPREAGQTIDPFRPFASSKSTGMGLGLSICQTIIEGHGGRIWTEENAPHGAIFHFTLGLSRDGLDA